MIYGRIGTKGHKGDKSTWSKSVAVEKNVTKHNGDWHGCTRGYRCEEESNHIGQSNTSR
jgi:hypothetical protein